MRIINAPVLGGFLSLRVRGASLVDRVLDVIAVDGEIRGRTPADFEVAGAALRVVTRPGSDGRV
ncbi:MAG TPA: hypothetical protein VGO81_12745 [Solirubrobacteraceae bacterium]|jgi:hypothetical protein|nr:hypothetical protein [Solirubrobacteraceae bacterium]